MAKYSGHMQTCSWPRARIADRRSWAAAGNETASKKTTRHAIMDAIMRPPPGFRAILRRSSRLVPPLPAEPRPRLLFGASVGLVLSLSHFGCLLRGIRARPE